MQQQKDSAARFEKESKMDDATEVEKRLAAEFGMSVAEYRLRQRDYVDATKQGKDDGKVATGDPKIGEESNEERFAVGRGMIGGGGGGDELTNTIQAVSFAVPGAVSKERIKEEGRALDEMKLQHQQRQQKENHEQQYGQHENYQVIEAGIEESIVEDNYVQISPYVSSYEQDNNERGRGDNDQQQQPNLSAIAEGMRVQQPQQSPRAQHFNEGGGRETASLPSLLNDGTRNHNSPHYDPSDCYDHNRDHCYGHYDHDNQRYNQDPNCDHQVYNHDRQDWGHHDPPSHYDYCDHSHHHPPDPSYPRDPHQGLPPVDPHSQFTIGSMVCVDPQKGDPLYGVVKWIGTIPDYPGTIAGVEMVNFHAIRLESHDV